jgi:hypothetical protein
MRRSIILVICATFLVSASGWAQRTNELQKGVRVRITHRNGANVVGAYLGFENDSVNVQEQGLQTLPRSMAMSDVSKIEVSNGSSRATGGLIKAAIGLGIGAAAGAVVGAVSYRSQTDKCSSGGGLDCGWGCFFVCSRSAAAGITGVLGGAAGFIVGGIYGLATGHESWSTVTDRALR